MTNEMINMTALELNDVKAQIKALEVEQKRLEALLQSELDEKKVDIVETNMFRIFWKAIERKGSIDTDAMAADGINVEKYRKASTVQLRFNVNLLKKKK